MAIQEVIKYEGDNQTLIYKHPAEDFNTLSQLIVHESQEAVFFSDGQALDTFSAGKYTLETANIPLISKLRNLISGGVSPFHCEVYFINMVSLMNVIWGTPSKVVVRDPAYGFNYSVGASGSFGVRVTDSRKLLIKYLGTEDVMTTSTIQKYFKDLIATRVKNYIAVELGKYSFNTINEHLNDISSMLERQIKNDIESYGIDIFNFFVSGIAIDDDDLNRLKELDNSVAEKKYGAIGTAQARQIEGYTWQEEKQADISKTFAQNEGFAAGPAGMMAQIPVGMAMGGMVNRAMEQNYQTPQQTMQQVPQQTFQQTSQQVTQPMPSVEKEASCPKCNTLLPGNAKFCFTCGHKMPQEVFCSNCGAKMPEMAKFCMECGTKRGE